MKRGRGGAIISVNQERNLDSDFAQKRDMPLMGFRGLFMISANRFYSTNIDLGFCSKTRNTVRTSLNLIEFFSNLHWSVSTHATTPMTHTVEQISSVSNVVLSYIATISSPLKETIARCFDGRSLVATKGVGVRIFEGDQFSRR